MTAPSSSSRLLPLFAAVVCFAAYASITAFRKAWNVAGFEGHRIFGLDYKVVLVMTQLLGYTLSKFWGIRFISELKRVGRWRPILLLVVISWLAWLLFALVPPPYNFWALALNGFPLGMLWGLVFSYVEGRRSTDFIAAALAVSFIFGPGLAKSVALWLMNSWQVSEYWMPFFTALVFFIPLLVFVYLLERIPAPSKADEESRTARIAMTGADRWRLVREFFPAVGLLVVAYIFITLLREIRDGFMGDMWRESGASFNAAVFAKTETIISISILVMIAAMVLVRNNARALTITLLIMMAGFLVSGGITLLHMKQAVSTFTWMTLVGLGLYMTYIPYNSILFERMLASFKYAANVGFVMYLADSFGYLASVSVLLSKSVFKVQVQWLQFYSNLVLLTSGIGIMIMIVVAAYFMVKRRRQEKDAALLPTSIQAL